MVSIVVGVTASTTIMAWTSSVAVAVVVAPVVPVLSVVSIVSMVSVVSVVAVVAVVAVVSVVSVVSVVFSGVTIICFVSFWFGFFTHKGLISH
jgi:hypothetical protein